MRKEKIVDILFVFLSSTKTIHWRGCRPRNQLHLSVRFTANKRNVGKFRFESHQVKTFVESNLWRYSNGIKWKSPRSTRSVSNNEQSHNQCSVRYLDARTQIVTLFDKTTHQQTEISSQELLSNQNHKLWRVELFPDDSLLLRFDDHERTGDQSQIIHHIVVHLKQINGKYRTISQIQATNAYGFAIASNSQVILGLRKPDSFEGLISCYL